MLPPKDSLESTDESQVKLCPQCLTSSDGAKHAGLRSLASRVFSLRAIETMRERIQLEIDNRLDELAGQARWN
jgi:cytochrome P450